ncbi:metallophosphoesterase [bacterium]|nr:MAG: metallophosphoesterase [bacterium]
MVVFFLIPQPNYREGFENLSQINQHAATLDELRAMEGSNFSRPDFSKYYATFNSTLIKRCKGKIIRILRLLHLKKAPLWSGSFFNNLLQEVIADREKRGWSAKPLIQKAVLDSQSRVVIFGDLQGAFHSLTRDLNHLKTLQIIDEQLRITQPNYYIVFIGNAINRSPYTLETLSIILRLMQRNPENVIYLKGKNEYYEYWKEHTLRDELKTKTRDQSTKKYSMVKEAQKFFKRYRLVFMVLLMPIHR